MNSRKIYIILPNIRSCHNVGAFFRTADAMEVEKIYLCGYTAAPPKPQLDKVALGAQEWIAWEKCETVEQAISDLKSQNVSIIALEKNDSSIDITSCDIKGDIALIFGHEVDGVSDETLSLVDHTVHIPMLGKKESLNVSVAGGIALYHFRHN